MKIQERTSCLEERNPLIAAQRNVWISPHKQYFSLLNVTNFTPKIRHHPESQFSKFLTFANILLCVGGWDGTTHLNSGEVYNPETDKWTFIAPASTSRWDAGVAVDGDKIFVVGGCDRNAVCTIQTECYNTVTDSWSQVTNLPVATHGLKCCTIQLPSKFVWNLINGLFLAAVRFLCFFLMLVGAEKGLLLYFVYRIYIFSFFKNNLICTFCCVKSIIRINRDKL